MIWVAAGLVVWLVVAAFAWSLGVMAARGDEQDARDRVPSA